MKYLILVIMLMIISFEGVPKNQEEKKILVILKDGQKRWTEEQLRDSVYWPMVDSLIMFKDSAAIERYGDQGKDGVCIITYKKGKIKKPVFKPKPLDELKLDRSFKY